MAPTPHTLTAGDRIQLTTRFLRDTANRSESRSVWTVRPCTCGLCTNGTHVATTEPMVGDWFTPDEYLAASDRGESLTRHFHVANVRPVTR